jgi:hypothetical protein
LVKQFFGIVMSYVVTVLHHIAFAILLRCIILFLAHVCSCTIDHVEPELEELTEQAQAEDPANLALDQGKPR